MKRRIAICPMLLFIAGCGGSFDETASQLQPGQWELRQTEIRVLAGDAGLPAKIMRCIPAEAGQKPEAFMPEWGQSNCTVSEFVIGKGRIRGVAKCERPNGAITTSFEGRFGASTYEITSRIDSNLDGKRRIIEERTKARRLGDCPAGEEQVVKITV